MTISPGKRESPSVTVELSFIIKETRTHTLIKTPQCQASTYIQRHLRHKMLIQIHFQLEQELITRLLTKFYLYLREHELARIAF